MSGAGLAAHWFRVAGLSPRLRMQAQVHRHTARGQVWYVLQDRQTGRFFRISPAANRMLCLMDGRRTMERISQIVADAMGPQHPTREETIRLLIQLYQSDLLQTGLPPDMAELGRRAGKVEGARWRRWFTSPMAMRFPLLDPDRFLAATLPLLRPLFSRTAFVLWLALVAVGIGLAVLHWAELSANVSDRVFTTYNVLMLLLLYPASKALHELGHAYATKAGGGEVHEMGLMLLVFFPVPYVDASAASAFTQRWRRVLVGSAGIMVELALAAAAMIAWVALPPGLWRAAAFNLMLLCSLSTLLFNGNPLLRFDGYYVLGDLLEIHNLDQRARRYLLYLVQRFGFGMHDADSPLRAPGEAKWLVAHGVAAFVYRLGVMAGIATVVAQRFFAVGVILAAVGVAQMVVLPVLRGLRYLADAPALRWRRGRAMAVAAAAAGVALSGLLLLPLPYAQTAEGVVWVPDEAVLRAHADGFVAALLAPDGHDVRPGQALIALEDPVAAAQVDVLRAQLAVASSRFDAVNLIDMVQARLAAEQVSRAQAALARAEQRQQDLLLSAGRPGRFVVPDQRHVAGRFVRNGDILGYVIGQSDVTVRAVVPQSQIDLVRRRTRAVRVRFTESIEDARDAELVRETPSALERPPAAALAAEAGGPMLLDPTSPHHDRPLDRWYEIAVRVGGDQAPARIGARAYVRFDFAPEPIAWRLLRTARQGILHYFGA